MDWYHPSIGLVSASSGFVLADIQYPAGWLRQPGAASEIGFIPTRWEARPDDRLFFVSDTVGTVEDGIYVVRWNATPRDPADIAKANALAEIDRLEKSITDRMWREDAVGSTALMEIKKQDENGDWVVDNDDPRTGKTATQYISYVNGAIANIRARL
ncbi:conserved exported protein of unknown function [Magnetospirillum sp. XM-1]|uniref:hypothetical protein n=1 Tax=Magnetospirillum sp. XM-1 TaxID=1663591 RepID=UPI00073DBE8B|nr:hypothetical protein [Magnetospirillum sp. XM-1]CUW38795.1 conserved exported protein of unknown function [Magnetospirillum sp. XM-1]